VRPIVVAAVKSRRLCERVIVPATTSFCVDLCCVAEFRRRIARIWFEFVERVTGNHIDEWLLTCERNIQEGD
jgi:hypothetical protein